MTMPSHPRSYKAATRDTPFDMPLDAPTDAFFASSERSASSEVSGSFGPFGSP